MRSNSVSVRVLQYLLSLIDKCLCSCSCILFMSPPIDLIAYCRDFGWYLVSYWNCDHFHTLWLGLTPNRRVSVQGIKPTLCYTICRWWQQTDCFLFFPPNQVTQENCLLYLAMTSCYVLICFLSCSFVGSSFSRCSYCCTCL